MTKAENDAAQRVAACEQRVADAEAAAKEAEEDAVAKAAQAEKIIQDHQVRGIPYPLVFATTGIYILYCLSLSL